MVAYKQDNAMVAKYPPQAATAAKHLPTTRRTSIRQIAVAAKHPPMNPPTPKHPSGKKQQHPLRQSIHRNDHDTLSSKHLPEQRPTTTMEAKYPPEEAIAAKHPL
jgi:hypothetical protein